MWSNCVVKQTTIQKYKFSKKLPKEKIKNRQQINQRKNILVKKKEKKAIKKVSTRSNSQKKIEKNSFKNNKKLNQKKQKHKKSINEEEK